MASVTVGGRGAALSSASVCSVARGLTPVENDSSILAELSRSSKHPPPSRDSLPEASAPASASPSLELSRAALIVLLRKFLLSSDTLRRPHIPQLIAAILNEPSVTLDVSSISKIATKEEKSVLDSASADLIGTVALLDCSSSALVPVLEAFAALSCEAIGAGIAQFDCPDMGDGFVDKDATDVASDLKDLLLGSKFVASGRDARRGVADIPDVHGSFRCAVRAVHKWARVRLNSKDLVKPKELLATLTPLVVSIQAVSEISFDRCKLIVETMDSGWQLQVRELFEDHCREVCEVGKKIQSLLAKVFLESDCVAGLLHETYVALGQLRILLAWESALALFTMELSDDDCNKEAQVASEMNGEGADGAGKKKDSKKKKKKKTKVLGRGTAIIRAFFKDKLEKLSAGNPAVLIDWTAKLSALMDPVDEGLDSFVRMVEEIVGSNESRRLPKIPKGTRDFTKEQMAVRERAYGIIVNVFKKFGAVALDTPTFELRETLMGKYGEDSKLIYDLADQGGEICALRYDLTVPFARYLAMNKINTFKRYHIAKVFRRDNPSKGRYREFCQCDFDIAGKCDLMEYDFEVIKVLTEVLDELNIGDYAIKLNHRKLLDGMMAICGVPASKFRTVCSSIDKLDKLPFKDVKDELVKKKGLSEETAEKIGTFIEKKGNPLELLSELKQDGSEFLKNEGSVEAFKELGLLFRALNKSKCIDKVVFDLSLARGLDYYTGVIFEAVFKGATQVGSIGAGGRYDNLVKQFGAQNDVPAVGASLGIERVLTIMEEQLTTGERQQKIRATETQVLVAAVGKDSEALFEPAVELVTDLRDANLKAEWSITHRPLKQIDYAKERGIPFMVFVGEEELKKGTVKIKEIAVKDEHEVPRDQLVAELQRRLNTANESIRHVVVQ